MRIGESREEVGDDIGYETRGSWRGTCRGDVDDQTVGSRPSR